MRFQMKLRPQPFDSIQSGQKTFELRLYDEKRQKIKVNDEIEFSCEEGGRQPFLARVTGIHVFRNFTELYAALPLLQCGYIEENVAKASPDDMNAYYSAEEQAKYGVVGIEIKLILNKGKTKMKRIYCGGTFSFDMTRPDYKKHAVNDYRAILLGSVDRLMVKQPDVMISEGVEYIGPFYVETADVLYGFNDEIIVQTEIKMIEDCTDAVFLLEEACCPGTIAELIWASEKGKNVALFFIRKRSDEETESRLHTPCWFAILMSQKINPATKLFSCASREDAVKKLQDYVCHL